MIGYIALSIFIGLCVWKYKWMYLIGSTVWRILIHLKGNTLKHNLRYVKTLFIIVIYLVKATLATLLDRPWNTDRTYQEYIDDGYFKPTKRYGTYAMIHKVLKYAAFKLFLWYQDKLTIERAIDVIKVIPDASHFLFPEYLDNLEYERKAVELNIDSYSRITHKADMGVLTALFDRHIGIVTIEHHFQNEIPKEVLDDPTIMRQLVMINPLCYIYKNMDISITSDPEVIRHVLSVFQFNENYDGLKLRETNAYCMPYRVYDPIDYREMARDLELDQDNSLEIFNAVLLDKERIGRKKSANFYIQKI